MQWLTDALDEMRHNDIDSDLHIITAVNHQGKTTKGEYRQMDMTKHFGTHDGSESEATPSPEEKAAKASRRDLYICSRLAAEQHAKAIEDMESGIRESIPGTLYDIEWRRHALSCALKHIEELEEEFADDPTIVQDMVETDRFFAELATALHTDKDTDKQTQEE